MDKLQCIRTTYGQRLKKLAESNCNIVALDADLACCSMTDDFKAAFPERHFNIGIAECNMIGIAAGLATTGKIPFANSFAMFSAGRAYDQVRNSVAYPKLNVKIIGTHAGISCGEDGPTHQCLEDLALMRVIPNMTVLCPCDANEMTHMLDVMVKHNGPCYVRMPRIQTEIITNIPDYKFEIGKGVQIMDGKDVTIIATGIMVQIALEAAEKLKKEGISPRVIDMHTIKPIDQEIINKAAVETGAIVTCEEHNILGGLGGAVAETLAAQNNFIPLVMNGINDSFGKSGAWKALLKKYGLTADEIVRCAKKAISNKQN